MAADAAIGSKITMALKAGSGVDINELATSLAEAESMAQIDITTKKKEETSVSISGYAVLKAAFTALKSSFDPLQDKDGLLTKAVFSQSDARVEAKISSQGTAQAGTTNVLVNSLASPQQNTITNEVSNADADFTGLTQVLNGGSVMTFGIQPKDESNNATGTNVVITTSSDTPQGIIDAVNAKTSVTGVRARALNMKADGTTLRIVLESKTGLVNRFLFTGHQGANALNNTQNVAATDLSVTVNGLLNVKRDNNSPSDLIDGVQLSFKETSSSSTNIVVSESADSLETTLNSMVNAYNNLIELTDYLFGDSDEEDEVAGSLSKDKATVSMALTKARSLLSLTSATASIGFDSLRNIGITSKAGGKIGLQEAVFASAIKSNFSDVRTMLTGDTNDQSVLSLSNKGLALDISIILDSVVSDTGSIKAKETNVQKKIANYEKQLLTLQDRFEGIKSRYLKQFAAMESLVQRNKNTGDYLASQFEAMQNSNN